MALTPGDTVGTYEVVRPIGTGGTAEVFEVRHTVLGTSHALKVLLPQWVENAQVRARFLQEGRIQSRLEHPVVVRVTDTVAEPGLAGLVMELLEGESLRDRLEREGRPAPKQAVAWVRAVLDALIAAHAQGVTHRDLKPENLFVERKSGAERIRLLDFGIAKAPEAAHQTSQRGALGTCAYMSPEQVRDPSSVDARTDVFAMGAVLWELLVGRPAFEGATPYESMQKVLGEDPGLPSERASDVPGWLDDVVGAALAKRPEDRIPTAQAFAAALDAGARGADLPAPAKPQKRTPGTGRTGWGWMAFGIVILGVPLFGLFLVIAVTASVAFLSKPTRIDGLAATSDACGNTTITVDTQSRSETLELYVDGRPLGSWPVSGQDHVVHVEPLAMGTQVTLEAHLNGRTEVLQHSVTGIPASLSYQRSGPAREGAVGRTLVRANGTCLPVGTSWEAVLDGVTTSGALPANQEIWLDTQTLAAGPHFLEVRLIAPGDGETLATAPLALTVQPPPPPGDLDQDGYLSRSAGGDDCDDSNPEINPGAAEYSAPNGVDDDCDGKVDEGTIAYDDDGDGLSEQQGDCDDGDRATHPGAPEVADCRDQDCDGTVDEGVTLGQRNDAYEPNDTQATARDLRTSTKRSFSQTLELVSSSRSDDEWFRFYSQDGDWDDWGIDVTVTRMPANSAIRLEVFDNTGSSRGTAIARRDGDQLLVRGRAFRDDSGDYTLSVLPVTLHADWCPVQVEVVSR